MVQLHARSWTRRLCGLSLAVGLVAAGARIAAERHLYSAQVYLDRGNPSRAVAVFDFRVNETATDAGGVQYITLYSADGTFTVPFEQISEIVFNRSLGHLGDTAYYDARVVLKQSPGERSGRIDLRVLRGSADSVPWHMLLASRSDGGANLHRIVFVG